MMEEGNGGILEYWNVGKPKEDWSTDFPILPSFHYSIIPLVISARPPLRE
jgi:hypothetical protein